MTKPLVAINGLGRIGRAIARIAANDADCPFDIVAGNDLAAIDKLAYLLKYDTVQKHTEAEIRRDGDTLHVGNQAIKILAERDPSKLPWKEMGVSIVLECTGRFRSRSAAAQHLEAGATKVIISAPGDAKDAPDNTVVFGINDDTLGDDDVIISAASCTTTCLAPVAKALNDAFGVVTGAMTTVHAYTADQAIVDGPHKDPRRGRSGAANLVPTSTGAAKAIGLVVPELAGKFHGIAVRVPVPTVSMVDLVVTTDKPITAEAANAALAAAAENYRPGTLRMEHDPVVSSDLIGETAGSVLDVALTTAVGPNTLKVISWYDNEWSYASRMYQLICHVASK